MSSSLPPLPPDRLPKEVLVVDDNRDLAANIAELLREEGIGAAIASDADEARAHMASRHCDLAIVDIRMPDTNGLTLLGEIKARCTDAEVIMMTATATLDTAVDAMQEGAFAYLEKPFDPQQLLTMTRRALTQVGLRRERARLQNELQRSEALYREVVDSVDALIVGLGPDGTPRMCNRQLTTTLGYPRRDLLSRPLDSLAASDAGGELLRTTIAQARTGAKQSDLEVILASQAGEERVTRWTFSRLEPVGKQAALVLGVGMDLTDRMDLERRAAEAEAMASIATLTAGLAHEIRNPLNAASLQLDLLERHTKGVDDEELRARIVKRVGIVEAELARLTNLLDDFLRLAKPQRLELVPMSLATLLTEVHALEEPACRKAGVELVLEESDEPLHALADHNTMTQVLVNLVVNAVDALANEVDGRITLRTFAQGSARVGIEVIDNGPGIPDDVAGNLFTPFVTSKEAGTGLGLTVVKRIVDRHGGSIQLTAAGDRGTIARIGLVRAPTP